MNLASAIMRVGVGGAFVLLAGGLAAEVELSTEVQRVEVVFADDQMQTRLVDAASAAPGDELRYTITFKNASLVALDPGVITITNPIPESTVFVQGTAGGRGSRALFSTDAGLTFLPFDQLTVSTGDLARAASAADVQAIRWTYRRRLAPDAAGRIWFHVRMN